ncbi:MAG: hypothetical protein Kow0092_03000 [Deferrisomatales bacterium]
MKVVGVRFKKAGRIYSFDAGDLECRLGDWLVVETERGMALGQVAAPPREPPAPPAQPLKRVLRRAEDRDILRYEQNCEMEGYAYQFCLEKIREMGLPMKLVDVEYLFDGSKVIFYFTAEGRVDFRELVRELARQFHTRIEMRQIGVRDEAKLVGGVGSCGRELCCATWLTEFAPISVRMAKDQNVSLNPSKISGICGRLMCCLSYEHAVYRDLARRLPKVGKRVQTPRGEGKVIRRNVLEGTFVVVGPGGEFEVSAEEMRGQPGPGDRGAVREGGGKKGRPRAGRAPRPDRTPRQAPPSQGARKEGESGAGEEPPARKRRRSRRKKVAQSPERKRDG